MVKLPSFDGATEWLNSGPLTPQAFTGARCPRQLRHVHLHQLDPYPALRAGVGR